jgi:hypothetical protein
MASLFCVFSVFYADMGFLSRNLCNKSEFIAQNGVIFSLIKIRWKGNQVASIRPEKETAGPSDKLLKNRFSVRMA